MQVRGADDRRIPARYDLRWALAGPSYPSSTEANATDLQGRTALHVAVANGHRQSTMQLLYNDADTNAQDKEGMTPLMLAAKLGHVAIAKVRQTDRHALHGCCSLLRVGGWGAMACSPSMSVCDVVVLSCSCC